MEEGTPWGQNKLEGLRIVYLEDDALISMNFVGMLEAAGCVVSDCSTIDEAMLSLDEGTYDLALLDLNIGGQPSYLVAQAALDLGMALVLVTGYDKETLTPEWRNHAVCGKPCGQEDLIGAIMLAMRDTDARARAQVKDPGRDRQ